MRFFLGYERYYVAYLFELLKEGKIIQEIKSFFDIIKSSKLSLIELSLYLATFVPHLKSFNLKRNASFVKNRYLDQIISQVRNDHSFSEIFMLQNQELTKNQLPRLLRYEDRNSMAFSIEGRVPIVDHRVIELGVAFQPT